jgi:DNA polymerase-3 subunit delta'
MQIYGHRPLFQQFLGSLNKQALHHAWLLSGPQGIGKASVAKALGRFLLRHPAPPYPESFPEEATDAIVDQTQSGAHPDFFFLQKGEDTLSQSKSFITVDAIRHVTHKVQQTAAYGGWKVVIIDSIDDMNEKAQNALLKTLEEPAAQTVFFLIYHGTASVAPTLRSRCHEIKMRPLSPDDMAQYIKEKPPTLTPQELEIAEHIAEGRLGIFEQLVHQQGLILLNQIIESVLEVLERRTPPYPKAFQLSESLAKEGESIEPLFYYLMTWYLQSITKRLALGNQQIFYGTKEEHSPLPWGSMTLESWLKAQERSLKILKEGIALKTDFKQRILSAISALNHP